MFSNKFEIIIKCNNCGAENKVFINGWARHTYDDCDDDIRLNIICNVCRNEDTITV